MLRLQRRDEIMRVRVAVELCFDGMRVGEGGRGHQAKREKVWKTGFMTTR